MRHLLEEAFNRTFGPLEEASGVMSREDFRRTVGSNALTRGEIERREKDRKASLKADAEHREKVRNAHSTEMKTVEEEIKNHKANIDHPATGDLHKSALKIQEKRMKELHKGPHVLGSPRYKGITDQLNPLLDKIKERENTN